MMSTGYDSTDLFCGAGGSGLGAQAAGVDLYMAANHSPIAIATHAHNFPHTEHDCADISQVNPRRYRRTRFLWASPECTNHSEAKGRSHQAQLDLFTEPDPTAERSRATMWDVVRFSEWHRYDIVIVENVVRVTDWELWPAWLAAMRALGYQHKVVSLNSMHAAGERAPRAPQSRDRVYVVFVRDGIPMPDLDPRPESWCTGCEQVVEGVQWWKNDRKIGKYRQQYLYRCPTCHGMAEPLVLPAAAIIDWSLPGQRIGDRDKPLSPKTIARIEAGLRRYAHLAQVVPAGGTWNDHAYPVTGPLRAQTTRETQGLLVPLEGRVGVEALPSWFPLRTQTTRHQTGLVVPYYSKGNASPVGRPLPTQSTVDRFGLAFLTQLRGGGCLGEGGVRGVGDPLATVTASGNHHMLVRHNGAKGDPGYLCTPVDQPARTITTAGHQSLVGWDTLRVQDCTFRMMAVPEIQGAMAFTPEYVVKGTKRQQVNQLGNAVTPPASEWLYRQCIQVLEAV